MYEGNPFANGLGGAAAPPSTAAAVTNLGVVGRGKGRITLQPTAAATAGGAPAAGGSSAAFAAATAAAAETAAEVPKKRSLEDIMGAPLA